MSKFVEAYRYVHPSANDAMAALTQMFGVGGARRRWSAACEACGVDPERELKPKELIDVATALIEGGGLASVVGRTLQIRVMTFSSVSGSSDE